MNKLFILDTMFSYGHINFNSFYLKILAERFELYILNNGQYYNELLSKNVHIINYKMKNDLNSSIAIRFQMVNMFRFIQKNKLLTDIKLILVMGYDTLVFPLFYTICKPKIPVYVIQHQNLDDTRFKIKHFAFNLYKNKITHLVLDEEFRDMLTQKLKVKSKILYLPHYLSKIDFCNKESESNIVVALSNSNDEGKIAGLITAEKKGLLKSHNIQIYAKSNLIRYKSDNLIVYKGYINDEIYVEKFKAAKAVLIMFPDSYDIRFSCTLIEGIINYKIVIGYNIPFVEIYRRRYPNVVKSFSNESGLFSIIDSLKNYNFDINERKLLISRLSEQTIRNEMQGIFHEFEN